MQRRSSQPRDGGRDGGRRGERGFTLLEVVIVIGLFTILLGSVAATVQTQMNAAAAATNDSSYFIPATAALYRIEDELRSVVPDPPGVTATPRYAVSATSITWRPVVGFISRTNADGSPNADYANFATAGRVSSGGILYADHVKTIAYDATARTVTLTYTGVVPQGKLATHVLATNVTSFSFFDGVSTAAAPPAPTTATLLLGFSLVVSGKSAIPSDRGKVVSSNPGQAASSLSLSARVALRPETLTTTRSRPVVGP